MDGSPVDVTSVAINLHSFYNGAERVFEMLACEMLERPDIQDENLVACLEQDYGLRVFEIGFLPLGADANTAVYRAVARDGRPYFVKLRRGDFSEITVTLPHFLHHQGIEQIIPPLPTAAGPLWTACDTFRVILYPFVEGHDGYQVPLSEDHWRDLGAALKRVHTIVLPPNLRRSIPRETYASQWRDGVEAFVRRVETETYRDPVAVELAAALRARRDEILALVRRAGQLARALQARSLDMVLCHADVHAGNVLVAAGRSLYIVDWDNPTLACKERDLMSIGADLFGGWRAAGEEEDLFYQGYGLTRLDPVALPYYRFERIVQDIAVECELVLLTEGGGDDRRQSLHYFLSNFRPDGTIELAYGSDLTQPRLSPPAGRGAAG